MPTNPSSEDLIIGGQNLSAEARAITIEAVSALKGWVDSRLHEITNQARTDLESAKQEIVVRFRDAHSAMEETSARMSQLERQLASLTIPLDTNLARIQKDLQEAALAATKDLEARRQAFEQGGVRLADLLGRAAKALV